MPDEECYRRVTDFHGLETRVRLLEEARLYLVEGQNHHEIVIDKLEQDSREMVTAIKLMAQSFLDFKKSFKTGFQLISTSVVVFVFIAGAFLKYSHDLDNKYAPKFDKLVSNTDIQKEVTLNSQAKILAVHTEIQSQKQVSSEAKLDVDLQKKLLQKQIDELQKLKNEMANVQDLAVIQASKSARHKPKPKQEIKR